MKENMMYVIREKAVRKLKTEQQGNAEAERSAGEPFPYREFYQETLLFHQRHDGKIRDAKDWEDVTRDMAKTSERMGRHPLMDDLLLAVWKELERKQQGCILEKRT